MVALIAATAGSFAAGANAAHGTNLDSFVAAFAERGPINGAVLVAQGDKILLARAFGYANMSFRVPNAVDTRYEVASITKTFTALIVLRLAEEGRIDLSANECAER